MATTTAASAVTATKTTVTTAEITMRFTGGASAVHATAETAGRSAAAMHAAAKTRLAAVGKKARHATMVKSTECAEDVGSAPCAAQ